MSEKKLLRNVPESLKKLVAGKQNFKCANKPEVDIIGLEEYECYLWKFNNGDFDESCYEIDHKTEYSLTHDDSGDNLQALCLACHGVKTKRFIANQTQLNTSIKNKQIIKQNNTLIKNKQISEQNNTVLNVTINDKKIVTKQPIAKYMCNVCNKNFRQKCHLDDHLNRKNKCRPTNNLPENPIIIPEKTIIIPENPIILIDNKKCKFCNKLFARKDVADAHMKQYCPIIKQQNKQLNREIKKKNKDKQLEDKDKQLEDKDKQLIEEISILGNEIKTIQPSTINSNNTVNVINIVPYGQEDLIKNKVDDLLLIISAKKGYNAVLELITRVHFNSRFPEFQNVYIPDIKNNIAMVFDEEWELNNIEDVISNLYDTNSKYITDNKDIFYEYLNLDEQIVYSRWAESNYDRESDEFKSYIAEMYKKIKLLMYNKRDMVLATKKLQAIKK
jgi:hypothetical protein